jgi:hypothetical protein
MKYDELERRAAGAEQIDAIEKLKSHARVRDVIEEMKAEGKALVLTAEEENMLWSFRRFKLRMRKDGEVFTWQTRRPSDVQIAEETGLIVHPNEIEQPPAAIIS